MGSWGVPCEGPHENPRSLFSPRAEKYEFDVYMYMYI